jgi:hypothetical protein
MSDDLKKVELTEEGCPASVGAGTRPCPMCAEPIRTEAVKCRFCGHMIAAVTAPVSLSTQSPEPSGQGVYEAPGSDGQIRLLRKRVIISRRGALGFLAHRANDGGGQPSLF